MACHAVQMWSLSGLVAAFLDLTIAYFLLCASSAAYLASKLLGFFRLNLPCPCDGMFINAHSKSLCFNRLLVDFPLQKLSDVHLSVRHKFPFSNSVSPENHDDCSIDGSSGNWVFELEGEASCCSSVSDARGSVRRELRLRTGKIDMKGKGILGHRMKSRMHQLRRVGVHGKNSSFFSYDHPPLHEEAIDEQPYNHFITNKRGSWSFREGSPALDNAGNRNLECLNLDDKAPRKKRGRHRTLSRDRISLSPDMTKSTLSGEESRDDKKGIEGCGEDENKIRLLERKLEKERAARAALYVELEEERSAAASAADEAMAMILRLQEEKASVEMEARQYQRIIEEKSAYDDEEMNILEEILLRREKEKLFLEREVEAYRLMVYGGNGQLTGDCSDNNDDLDDKPALWVESSFQRHDEQSSFERIRDSNETEDKDIQSTPKASLECEKVTKELEQGPETDQETELAEEVSRTCYGDEKGDPKQQPEDAPLDKDPHVYDVHIVGDGERTEDKDEQYPSLKVRTDSIQSGAERERIKVMTKSPSASCLETEPITKKSSREVNCLPPIPGRGLSQGLRRSSMSAVDTEMLKIDSEIVRLQERLKHVQKGRGKLGFSLENRESKNSQLRFLESIARQIQDFRCLNGPRRAARQASLPPPNSKGLSKKRRSRSVSSGFQMSPEG